MAGAVGWQSGTAVQVLLLMGGSAIIEVVV
jgi:hypothetical protein